MQHAGVGRPLDDAREQPQRAVGPTWRVASCPMSPSISTRSSRQRSGNSTRGMELDPARLTGLRDHVDRAVVREHERVGQVVVALEHPLRGATAAPSGPSSKTEIAATPGGEIE